MPIEDDDEPEDEYPERGKLLHFPNHPVSSDGFIKSRIPDPGPKARAVAVHFKISATEARQLEEIAMEYREEGYRTVSDVLRHGVRDHIQRLTEYRRLNNASIDNTWSKLQVMLDQARDDLLNAQWGEVLAKSEEQIRACQQVGAKGEIKRKVRTLRLSIRAINSRFWSVYWEKELTKRWGEYL